MIDLPYSLVIEATEKTNYFGFYSPDLGGLTGIGSSIDDCIKRAKIVMKEHLEVLKDNKMAIPSRPKNPTILIQNELKEIMKY